MRHDTGRPTLVRLHSECLTGDVLGSERCDCGPQLREAVGRLDRAGGYLLYLRQEGRGIGLYAKLDAYQLQSEGLDTYAANRLLSNNPDKAVQLNSHGVTVVEEVPTAVHLSSANARYLATKAAGGHALDLTGL